MTENDIISSSLLIEKLKADSSNSKFNTAGLHLLEAINDWPTLNLAEPVDFLKHLKKQLKSDLTFENISAYCSRLKVSKDAWKMESLTSLLKVFDYDQSKDLDNIIRDISRYYRS